MLNLSVKLVAIASLFLALDASLQENGEVFTLSRASLPFTARLPSTCYCSKVKTANPGACFYFTNKAPGACRSRPCRSSFVCVGGHTPTLCMKRKTTKKMVEISPGYCVQRSITGYQYVPYSQSGLVISSGPRGLPTSGSKPYTSKPIIKPIKTKNKPGLFLVVVNNRVYRKKFLDDAKAILRTRAFRYRSRAIFEVKGGRANGPSKVAGYPQNKKYGFSTHWKGGKDVRKMRRIATDYYRRYVFKRKSTLNRMGLYLVISGGRVIGTYYRLNDAKSRLARTTRVFAVTGRYTSTAIFQIKYPKCLGPFKIDGYPQSYKYGFHRYWRNPNAARAMRNICMSYFKRSFKPKFKPLRTKFTLLLNYRMPGSDLPRMPRMLPTVYQCIKACQASPRCKAYTFSKNRCYLKKRVPRARRARGYISGRRKVKINSMALTRKRCHRKCKANPRCKTFIIYTYNGKHLCRFIHKSKVSAYKVAKKKCDRRCKANPRCKTFFIVSKKGKHECRLKFKPELNSLALAKKNCKRSCGKNLRCASSYIVTTKKGTYLCRYRWKITIRHHKDLPGQDYRRIRVKNYRQCWKKCLAETRCKSYTYYKNNCFLKHGVPKEKSHRDAFSGVKLIKKNIRSKFTIRRNKDLYGYDLPRMPIYVKKLEKCLQKCQANKRCKSYTYYEKGGKKMCFLKHGVPKMSPMKNAISGVKKDSLALARKRCRSECQKNPRCKSSPYVITRKGKYVCRFKWKITVRHHKDLPGLDIRGMQPRVKNVEQCWKKCLAVSRCKSYTYYKGTCYLKYGVPKEKPLRDGTSGVKM